MDDSAGNGRAASPRRPGGAAMEEAGRSASQSGPQAGQSGPQAGHPSAGGSGPLSASRSASQSAGLSSLGASGVQARWLGKRVGRFRLVSMLGKGAYGRVFLAEDVDLQRRVALKIITAEATSKSIREEAAAAGDAMDSARLDEAVAQAVDRMIREARAAARMEHPNVVHVYEIGRLDGTGLGGYIAMELLDGGTLQDLIRATGPMDAARACTLVAEAADALQHGHDMGVVHRDVKPANLMLSRAGRCKVADFGLACVDDPNDCHRAMPIAGTALFLAPEIMSGALPDPKTDQYSLAVTLFTLLAGRPPYVGTRRQVLEAHVRSPVPDLLMVRPDLDPKLFEVIRRGMSKDPGKRFPSIRQFGQALRLFTVAVAAPPPAPEPMPAGVFDDVLAEAAQGPSIATPVHYAPRRSMDLSKVLPLAIGGGIVAMLLIIVLILWAAGAFSRPEPQAQLSQRPPAPQQRPAEPARNDPPANNPPVEQPRQQQQQQPEQKPEPVQPPPAQPQQQPPPQQQQQQEQAPPAGIQPPAQQPGQAAAGGAPEIKLGPGELAATDYRGLVRVAMGYDTERANKRATVVGHVAAAQISESGKVVRITFKGAEGDRVFDVAYFPDNNLYQKMADRFGGANGAGLKGKTIRVTGSVTMYQNDPQIVIDSPDQITIIE